MSYLKAIEMGAIAGLRSMAAPALVSDRVSKEPGAPLGESPLAFLGVPEVAASLKVLAAGEMVADKTPWIPNRTEPISVAARMGSGALVGAAITSGPGLRPEIGALFGALGAFAATYAAFYVRKELGRAGIPDPILAVAEDTLVVTAGTRILEDVAWASTSGQDGGGTPEAT